MQKLIEAWSGESVVTRYDHAAQTWMFIAIHDTTLGAAMGGCRMKVYGGPEEALHDAMRLAEGMTYASGGSSTRSRGRTPAAPISALRPRTWR
jgi:hypothetical protein